MSFIDEASGNRVNDNDVVNTIGMILCAHHIGDSLKYVKSYRNSFEKEKNKKYD